jgi:hypothetical protein
MQRLRHLTGQHRTASINRLLGGVLAPESRVRANRMKLRLFGTLLGMFVAGGVVGASGFKYVGFIWVVPLALLLLALSLPPLYADFHRTLRRKVKAIQQSS